MAAHRDLLSQVCWVQTRNSTLANDELREAAKLVAAVADNEALHLMPVDEVGDRIIGAALATRGDLLLADASHRLDGAGILLVTGHLAGAVGVALKASRARALGAARVDAAVLGGGGGVIAGCEGVWDIAPPAHPRLVV